jgi:hypothetical protein
MNLQETFTGIRPMSPASAPPSTCWIAVIWLALTLNTPSAEVIAGERKASPEPQPALETSAEFLQELKALLDLGLNATGKEIAQATAHYRKASRIRPDDPRVEFAYSLVLSKQFRPIEARQHLQAAAEHSAAWFPARQALVRDLIRSRKFEEAGDWLARIAHSLDPHEPLAAEHAQWVGRIVACLIGPVGPRPSRERFGYLHTHIRASLPAVLDAAYDRGFQQLEHEVEQLHTSIELAQATAESTSDVAKSAADSRLAQTRALVKIRQEDARKAAKQWGEWVTDEARKIDETLKEMEKQYDELEQSSTALLASISSLRLQIDRIDRGIGIPGIFAGATFGPPQRIDVERQALVDEEKLYLVYAAQQELTNRAAAQLSQRKAIVAEYERATGQVYNDLVSLKKWDERATKIAEREHKQADRKPAAIANLEARARSLNTYDPMDFRLERERLLAEYGVRASRKE